MKLDYSNGFFNPHKTSIIKQKAEKDPNYCPYCIRCNGLRKQKVEHLYWKCKCGAEHDERIPIQR